MGQSRHFDRVPLTSDLPRQADMCGSVGMSQTCHFRTHALQQRAATFVTSSGSVGKPPLSMWLRTPTGAFRVGRRAAPEAYQQRSASHGPRGRHDVWLTRDRWQNRICSSPLPTGLDCGPMRGAAHRQKTRIASVMVGAAPGSSSRPCPDCGLRRARPRSARGSTRGRSRLDRRRRDWRWIGQLPQGRRD
jgi:hypothetical protein